MTTNSTLWNPPVGRLIFRTITWAPGRNYSCLGVASKSANEHGMTCYESIAEIDSEGHAKPSFCGWVNGASQAEDKTGSGNPITQRLATDEDIAAVVRTWESRYSICEWIEDIASHAGSLILPEELDRIRRIVAAGPWNPPVGHLFVCVTTDPNGPKLRAMNNQAYTPAIDLCYRLDDERAFRYAVILVSDDGRARAGEHVLVELLAQPASYTSASGLRFERRMATDADLWDLLAAWGTKNMTLEQWLLTVKLGTWMRPDAPKLTGREFARLTRLVAAVSRAR